MDVIRCTTPVPIAEDYEVLCKRLEKLKWMVNCEVRGMIPDTTAYGAAAAIRALSARVAQLEALKTEQPLPPKSPIGDKPTT